MWLSQTDIWETIKKDRGGDIRLWRNEGGRIESAHIYSRLSKFPFYLPSHSKIKHDIALNANRGVPLDSIALPGNFDGLKCFFHCQQCLNVTGSAGYRGFPILIKQLLAEKTNKPKNKQKQLIIFNSFTLVFTHICIRYENKKNQSLIHAIHVLTAFSNFS